jgi:hypothetical protein
MKDGEHRIKLSIRKYLMEMAMEMYPELTATKAVEAVLLKALSDENIKSK